MDSPASSIQAPQHKKMHNVSMFLVAGLLFSLVCAAGYALTSLGRPGRPIYSGIICFIVVFLVILEKFQDRLSKVIATVARAKRFVWIAKVVLLAKIYCLALVLGSLVFTLVEGKQGGSLAFSIALKLLLVGGFIIWLFDSFRWRSYYAKRSPGELVSDYYMREYLRYSKERDLPNIKMCIEKACEFNPSAVAPWLLRSLFAVTDLLDADAAWQYLDKTKVNMENCPDTPDPTRAMYEFCQAVLLIKQGRLEEATTHARRSLELCYSKGRAEYLAEFIQLDQQNTTPADETDGQA